MGEAPFVSIVVPTRNRVAILRACLNALSTLDYPKTRYEILVVDDGSSDGTRESVEGVLNEHRIPRVRYVHSEGRGANAARNLGILETDGDLVCFVDDDVLPPERWLSTLVDAMVSQELELTWGPVILPPELKLPGRHRSEVASYLSESMIPQIPLLCNMLVRRGVFQRGVFDSRLSAPVEEVEWLFRTEPRRAFTAGAWLWHSKSQEDCAFGNIMSLAWSRGSESGSFDRTRLGGGIRPLMHAVQGALRSIGHAVKARCLGGVLVAAGRAGYAYGFGLGGLRRRGAR